MFTMIDDDVHNETVMDWYIPRVKANLAARNTFLPCHIVADPCYHENIQVTYQSPNPNGIFSWMTALIHY
jgi:hypothetical protein